MMNDILVDPGEHILTKRRCLDTLRKCINQYLPQQMKQYDRELVNNVQTY